MENVAKLCLAFSNAGIIIPFIILGYIWGKRSIFYNAICLLLISMIVNVVLKMSFQIPLSPLLGKEGFAFPSGHMQSSCVFYGWLAFTMKKRSIRIFISLLLGGIGLSLVYFGYHTYGDILGALFFALLLGMVYILGLSKISLILPWVIAGITSFLMVYIYIFYKIENDLWMAYYALLGFMLSEKLFGQKQIFQTMWNKVIMSLLCFSTMYVIEVLFSFQILAQLPSFLSQMRWLLIGFSIPAVQLVGNHMGRDIERPYL